MRRTLIPTSTLDSSKGRTVNQQGLLGWLLGISLSLSSVSAQAVWGGDPLANSYPLAASLLRMSKPNGDNIAHCKATLIAPLVAITARHCLAYTQITLPGAADKSCGKTEVIEAYYEGPSDNTEFGNTPDIAILRLKSPLCGGKPVDFDSSPLKVDQTLKIVSHSHKVEGDAEYSLPLQIMEKNELSLRALLGQQDDSILNPIRLPMDFLDQVIIELIQNENFMLAIPEPGSATCKGDSGASLYSDAGIVGILHGALPSTSTGVASCRYSRVSYFTPVARSLPWIRKKLVEWQ